MNHTTVQAPINNPVHVDQVMHDVEDKRISVQVTDERDNHTVAWIVPDALMRALAPGLYR